MESSGTGAGTLSGLRRMVIVADNSLIVEAIRIGFRNGGEFRLVGHADGRTTSAKTILAASPEVVLVDEMDRSESVVELIREIKADSEHTSVIVLSAHLDRGWLERIFRAGATGALSKATHPAALTTLVRETVAGHIALNSGAARSADDRSDSSIDAAELPLTARELEILRLVASGSSNGGVARQLWVTEQTVKFHLRNIYRKLDVANRTEASHFAHINGLVSRGFQTKPELPVAS